MTAFPPALQTVLDRAAALGLPVTSEGAGGAILTLESAWRAREGTADLDRQIPILDCLSLLSDSRPQGLPDPGMAVVEITPDRQSALLTLIPPAPNAPAPDAQALHAELHHAGVVHGIDAARVDACAHLLAQSPGWIVRVTVARGTASVPGTEPRPEFMVPVFPLRRIRQGEPWTGEMLRGFPAMPAGTLLGRLHPGSVGTAGKDVLGKPTQTPPKPPAPLSERVAVDAKGQLMSRAEGVLTRGPDAWDVVPLFLVQGDYLPESGPIHFPGIVAIEGSCRGTALEADELCVGGNLSGGQVVVGGEIHVAGTISGGGGASLSADGMVTARSIDAASVQALGDVVVRRNISNSDVTTLGRVVVTDPDGEISGGTVAAFRGLSAAILGSDFGAPTAVAAGRDFLTPKRLAAIEARIALHQENLHKITALKRKLALAGVDPRHMPPDKQDIFLGVLKKETGSKQELAALERQRERFRQAVADFLEATVQVGQSLHPPVEVRIGDALRKIQESLRAIVLTREGDTITAVQHGEGAPT